MPSRVSAVVLDVSLEVLDLEAAVVARNQALELCKQNTDNSREAGGRVSLPTLLTKTNQERKSSAAIAQQALSESP